MLDKIKEFRPSSWAIDNKTAIYVLTFFLLVAGVMKYNAIPKEQFPEIVLPQILVNTVYPGTSPSDMENLVTKEIEKEAKAIAGVKKINSNSVQNFSSVIIEFSTDQDVEKAKQRVKDAVDKATLPSDLPQDPSVIDIDVSQQPIMNVNLSGDISLDALKKYADVMKDKIEALSEIRRVDLIGALDREIQVNVDLYKMEVNNLTFGDIERAVQFENMTISGGEVDMGNVRRNLNVVGQYVDPNKIGDIVLEGGTGAKVRLRDIAEVKDAPADRSSYARLNGKNVITLNVVKKGGKNLLDASDKIFALTENMKSTGELPKAVDVTITGDQSDQTRTTLADLINTIIIGFLLVTLILMFFMGATNAIFVGLSVPLSMCIAFLVEPSIVEALNGKAFSMNMIVLFAFLLALGIVVDDAIVVIENTHRIFDNGKVPIVKAAKLAAGEVFIPVFSGTLTTLAPFFPLMFWEGTIGEFMFFLPITMIVVLFASLIVAYIINPVFAVDFMKPHVSHREGRKITRSFLITSGVFTLLAFVFYGMGNRGMGNLIVTIYVLFALHKFILEGIIQWFQNSVWVGVQNGYVRMMRVLLKGKRAFLVLGSTIFLFFFTFYLMSVAGPNTVFFPTADPNFAFAYIRLPVGTDVDYTDKVAQEVEARVFKVIGKDNPLVKSVITNVAVGANDPNGMDFSTNSNAAKVTVAFVPFEKRHGKSTLEVLTKIREAVKGIPSAEITVEQEQGGPPTQKPISIEISGEKFEDLTKASVGLKKYLDNLNIAGVEELKSDLVTNKPEIVVNVDRVKANREGISTAQIGLALRTSVFGKEVSKFKDANDDYPIQVRLEASQRNNINVLMNQKITFRDMNMGGVLRSVPLSAVADIRYANTYGGITRKNQKRLVTLSSNVLADFNPNNVVAEVQAATLNYQAPDGTSIKFGGELEQQEETGAFLGWAFMASIGLILVIMVMQFNSISRPLIIFTQIIFSIIGVLLGFIIFRMDFSIIMTGIGIIALMGIVVRNGILLVEFIDLLLAEGMDAREAVIEAGKIRMTPVLLTASATVLGLIPLAIGLNINFVSLFTDFNPHIFLGGDNVAFWGPLSWTMIFGLIFATFLTLILVPAMVLMVEKGKARFSRKK